MGPRRRALEVYSRAGVFRTDAHFQTEVIHLLSSRKCPRGSWPGGFCVYARVSQECNQVGEGPLQEAPVKQIRQRITSSQAEKPGQALQHRGITEALLKSTRNPAPPLWKGRRLNRVVVHSGSFDMLISSIRSALSRRFFILGGK